MLGLDQITQVLLTPIAVGLMNAPEITEIQMTNQNRNFHPSKGASDSHPQADKYVGLYLC